MKKLSTILIAFLVIVFNVQDLRAQVQWKVDPYHSKVNFTVSHLVISEVDGNFKVYDGQIISDKTDFSDANISFTIDATSINTDNEQRDGHLKSEGFFHAEKHPKITFKSTSFKKTGENTYALNGKLNMRGVTKDVTLAVKYGGIIGNDGNGNTKAGFIVTGTLNRMDYGIAWNDKTENGGLAVGEDVNIRINLEFVKQA